MLRRFRVLSRRFLQNRWRDSRTALNVAWLALCDPAIGWGPKALGAGAALVGVMPLEWVPGIHPIVVLFSDFVLIPALLWLAWLRVSSEHKLRLTKQARSMSIPWAFFALVAGIFLVAVGIDTFMDLVYPGQDAFTPMIDPWVEDLLVQGEAD